MIEDRMTCSIELCFEIRVVSLPFRVSCSLVRLASAPLLRLVFSAARLPPSSVSGSERSEEWVEQVRGAFEQVNRL